MAELVYLSRIVLPIFDSISPDNTRDLITPNKFYTVHLIKTNAHTEKLLLGMLTDMKICTNKRASCLKMDLEMIPMEIMTMPSIMAYVILSSIGEI